MFPVVRISPRPRGIYSNDSQTWLHFQILSYPVVLHAKLLQLGLTLCDPMDCSPPGFSFRGILHARILEWVAIPFSMGSSRPRGQAWVSCITGRFFTTCATREARWSTHGCVLVSQSHPALHSPVHCSPPGSPVHGILQTKILECVSISFSRGSSRPGDRTPISCTGRRTLYLESPSRGPAP